MRTQFPRTKTVRAETSLRSHALLIGRIIRSIDDFLKVRNIEIGSYELEREGDDITVTIEACYETIFVDISGDLIKHLETDFGIRDLYYKEKKKKPK